MTKTKTYADRVAESKTAYATAKGRLIGWRTSADAAEAAEADAVTRLGRGDDTVTTDDLLKARADVERYGYLIPAGETALTAAERGLLSDDTTLANLLAPYIAPVVGIEAVVVNELPTVTNVPHLAISQTRDIERNTLDGTVSGSVEVAYTRTAQHVPLTDVALEKVLAVKGWRIEVPHGGTDWSGDHHVDRFSVLVARASEPVPVIDVDVPEWVIRSFSGFLPMRLRDRLTTGYAGSAEVHVETNSGQHVGTVVGADGIRRVRIGVTAGLGIGTGQWNATQLADQAADVFRQMVGTHADMLGVIESVEMGAHKVWGDVYAHGVSVSATFTLVARTSAE